MSVPGPLYCDSSALAKLYWPEAGSEAFNRMVQGRHDLLVSDLALTETVSAVSRRMREGVVTGETARRVQQAIVAQLDDGSYQRVELTRHTHRQAESLLIALTATPLRAADALHLAMATSARAASLASFDARLRAAARAVGLYVSPPQEAS